MKGKVTIYFGKSKDMGFMGESADTIKLETSDIEATLGALIESQWARVGTNNGHKYINTQNILWFDVEEENDV